MSALCDIWNLLDLNMVEVYRILTRNGRICFIQYYFIEIEFLFIYIFVVYGRIDELLKILLWDSMLCGTAVLLMAYKDLPETQPWQCIALWHCQLYAYDITHYFKFEWFTFRSMTSIKSEIINKSNLYQMLLCFNYWGCSLICYSFIE